MAAADQSKETVWRPSTRAFFVYYVAIAVAVFGPRINPAVGIPPWVGLVLGFGVLGLVCLRRFGQEYRATPRGLKRVSFWPAAQESLTWPEVGELTVQRGLTQTLLNTGTVVIHDKQGVPKLMWERLADPQGVKAALEARRAAFSQGSDKGSAAG
jgi:hypothetical protein|uniref:PH domain-containing protein n=1 Tax=Desulfobacca acetoxidans TaxID=60893 RepID=A0A7V6A482_9BACT